MKKIGITFTSELKAAGLLLDGITWDPETGEINFDTSVSDERRAAIMAVYEAHDPNHAEHIEDIMRQIVDIESTITPRRLREAVLGIDSGWLAGINQQLSDLRVQLK